MERKRAFLNHRDFVQPFLKEAFKEGAHRIKPKYVKKVVWLRQMMIGVVYNDIGSTATLEELADKYGTFRQSISSSNKFFLGNLWNNSSPELQGRYPLSEVLSARKPLSQRSREKQSASMGGTRLKIRAQIEAGVTDIRTISEKTGIPVETISGLRTTTLKNWGIDVPRMNVSHKEAHEQHKEILQQLKEETDDKKIQELLDKLPLDVIIYDINKNKGLSQFFLLASLVREFGFNPSKRIVHIFADTLRKSKHGIPITRKDYIKKNSKRQNPLTHYILLSRHRERAREILIENELLGMFLRS